MNGMATLPPELLMLPAFSLALGVDLYLMLLFLGLAPHLGWWPELPGVLGDLATPGVLIIAGSFYLTEIVAERFPTSAILWNALHAIIRPLSGALMGLLLLDGQSTAVLVGGALAAGLLAGVAHAATTGGAILRQLTGVASPRPGLVATLEDVTVLGLVVLALDAPRASLVVATLVGLGIARGAPSQVRAFEFSVRLVLGQAWRIVSPARWRDAEAFPRWVRRALADDVLRGLRGSPVGVLGLPGAPRFSRGWLVVRGGTPVVLLRRGRIKIDLAPFRSVDVTPATFFRRVELARSDGGSAYLYFALDGPTRESLEAEFAPV